MSSNLHSEQPQIENKLQSSPNISNSPQLPNQENIVNQSNVESQSVPITGIIKEIKDLKVRPTWDQYFVTMSHLISQRSTCDRLHVGCVIVKDNRVVTTGYNGFISGAPHIGFVRDNHEQMTIHAETNAIADAAKRGVSLEGGVAYVTHCPCINCCKVLIASGIKTIIYSENYKNDELVPILCERGNVLISKFE